MRPLLSRNTSITSPPPMASAICAALTSLVEKLAYQQYRRTTVAALSGGTKQKLNLTLALMHDPHILLLDEPYQGFDWETYLRFWDLAADLRARGCAVLIISHLLFDQERFDALYQLQNGRLRHANPAALTEQRARKCAGGRQ